MFDLVCQCVVEGDVVVGNFIFLRRTRFLVEKSFGGEEEGVDDIDIRRGFVLLIAEEADLLFDW